MRDAGDGRGRRAERAEREVMKEPVGTEVVTHGERTTERTGSGVVMKAMDAMYR